MAASPAARLRVLVVDDSEVDREKIRRLLGADYAVAEARTAREGLRAAAGGEAFDCVLLDNRLPDLDGIDVLEELSRFDLPVLMLTAKGSEALAVEAMKRGALDYLSKGRLEREELRHSIDTALERVRLRRQIDRQQQELRRYVGELARQQADLEASSKALAEREAQIRLLMEQLPAIAWTTDRQLRFTSLTGAGLRALGLEAEALVGQEAGASPGPGAGDAALAAHGRALSGEPARYELRALGRNYDCHVEPLREEDGIAGVVGLAVDVTERRSLEQQLLQSQKMEAVGQLAGGVAHDFNNLLTAITSFAAFAQESVSPEDPAHADLDQVLLAAGRASALVRQLLAFSRKQPASPQVVDVGEVARGMAPMLRRLLGEDVSLELAVSPELWRAFVDPGGLEQVIVNLVLNARDAMPEGGRIRIEVENEDGEAGRRLALIVRDEGAGIRPDLLDRIFEPFFTTKAVGKGTGLGLSTCYGIVRKAGGSIEVESEAGKGSVFRVLLPPHGGGEHGAALPPAPALRGGAETVLVIEDEAPVRQVIVRALARLGYAVLEADGGERALEICGRHVGPIDLVVSDVVMPNVSGPAVASEIARLRPGIRVLFVSGFSEEAARRREFFEPDAPLLEKPLTAESIGRKVREVLDAPR